jgi:hypothetical protein
MRSGLFVGGVIALAWCRPVPRAVSVQHFVRVDSACMRVVVHERGDA